MDFPRKLKKLLRMTHGDEEILVDPSRNFFVRTSNAMRTFLELCEHFDEETIRAEVLDRYSRDDVNRLFMDVELNSESLFWQSMGPTRSDRGLRQSLKTLTLNCCRGCNMSCSYCFEGIPFRRLEGMMKIETALRAVELFWERRRDERLTVIFTGGEPLLNLSLIEEVVQHACKQGWSFEYLIKTNGTLLSDAVADFLVENNFRIQISLDGDKETHNRHRAFRNGRSTFRHVDQAIRRLIDRGYGGHVSLAGTVTHFTIGELQRSYRYWSQYDEVSNYGIRPVMVESQSAFSLTDMDYSSYVEETVSEYAGVYGRKTSPKVSIVDEYVCSIGVWNVTVDCDGMIYPCYRLCGLESFAIGNLFESGLELSDLPGDLKAIYAMEDREECTNCYAFRTCRSGCYAEKLLERKVDFCNTRSKTTSDLVLRAMLVENGVYKLLPTI